MSKINIAKVAHFTGHRNAIYTLERSIYSNCFYSASADGFVVEWDCAKKVDGKLLANLNAPVYSLLLDQVNHRLLCGTAAGRLIVIDLLQNRESLNIEAHGGGLYDLNLVGDKLISAGGDGMVKIWKSDDLTLVKTIHAGDKSARVIAINPSTENFAVGSSDWSVKIYDSQNFGLIQNIQAHQNSVFALTYTPDAHYLLSSGRDAMLKVFDADGQFKLLKDIPAHTGQVKCIACNPAGELFATSSMDKTIKIWDASTFELLKVVDKSRNESHSNCINKLLWMDNTTLVSCSDDRAVMVWDISLTA